MILVLDVGNTQIYGGVFDKEKIKLRFRKKSKDALTSDELGIFLKQVLRENKITPSKIKKIAVSSVVPDVNHTISNCCVKYFNIEPFFIGPGIKTGLNFQGRDILAYGLGADRVADAIAAMHKYPGENLIVIDFGTANTYDAISKEREYKGGAIQIGLGTSLNALAQNAALLSKVEILKPAAAGGLTTETQMQAGMYYGSLGAVKEFVARLKKESFNGAKARVVLTGGLGRLYEGEDIIDVYEPDLVLNGIKLALEKNSEKKK